MKGFTTINKRKHSRQRTRVPVAVTLSGARKSMKTSAYSVDVSEGGLAFKTDEKIPLGSGLTIDIQLPSQEDSVTFKGTVNRLDKIDDNGYFHGIEFVKPQSKNIIKLKEYLSEIDVKQVLSSATKLDATDVHIMANRPPFARIQGNLQPLGEEIVDPQLLEQMITAMLTERQLDTYLKTKDLDFSFPYLEDFHCRANVHFEMGNMALAVRLIPKKIKTCRELGVPVSVEKLALKKKGLIIVTGPSGSGKSSTLAAVIDVINSQRSVKIITIEDPIEYVYSVKKSLIAQRELGVDTDNYASALKYALRQDPDVIMLGELRDVDSISMAITAAETGHLVLTTLHTSDTIDAINRIIDVYSVEQQDQIRCQLADGLTAIVGQSLVPSASGEGRKLATEVLIATPAVRNMVRSGSTNAIRLAVEMGQKFGMHTMDQDLLRLVSTKEVKEEVARAYSRNPHSFGL